MAKAKYNKLGQKGAASIFIVMSILTAVLVIALGSSLVVSTEIRMSSGSAESVAAYYAAESGIEAAMYGYANLAEPETSYRCAGSCNGACCTEGWKNLGTTSYCLNITEDIPCDYSSIKAIQSIGEYKTVRRSIEISF